MWAFLGHSTSRRAIAWMSAAITSHDGVQGKTTITWCGSWVPGVGLRNPSEHPGVRGWPGGKLFCPYRLEKFSKFLAACLGSFNLTVILPLFFRGVSVAFRGTSVAMAPKHTHVDEGAKICAAPLLYDVGFVGFSGVGRALNWVLWGHYTHVGLFGLFGCTTVAMLRMGCHKTKAAPTKLKNVCC